MPRCVHPDGCANLVRQGFDLCGEHDDGDERSPCCGAQIMAELLGHEGGPVDWSLVDPDDLIGVCSMCDRIIYEGGKRVLVPVGG